MLNKQDLKSSNKKELAEELKKAHAELQKLRMGVKTKHLKDTTLVNKQKKYIARIITFLKDMELNELVKQATQA